MLALATTTARIRTRFEAESTVRWPDAVIHVAVNEALDELSEATGFVERVVSIPQLADRNFYDLRGYVPDDFIIVRAVWSTVREDWLTPDTEDSLGPRWEGVVGDPRMFFMRGWSWLGVYPHPTASTGFLRVYLTTLAPQFLHSQAVLSDLPDDLVPALEDYALYTLQALDGAVDKALLHWKDFVARQQALGEFVSQRTRSSGYIGGRR